MKVKAILGIFFTLIFLSWGATRIVMGIQYDINVGGHLERAGNANTVEMAERELGTALSYLERHEMTTGYTSILWRTPAQDVGFWYNNLRAAHQELITLPPTVTPLERSNVLMRIRETLLDTGSKGTQVTQPSGISVYPYNVLFAAWGAFSFLFAAIFLFRWIREYW